MRLLGFFVAAATILSASLAATSARADSIVFDGQSGNAYNYGIDVTSSGLIIDSGATLAFIGLADVTGASSFANSSLFADVFTPTSVVFVNIVKPALTFVGPANAIDIFTIDSTATVGNILYVFDTGEGVLSGLLGGPAVVTSITPEPSSIALLGTGLLGVAGVMKRRFV